MIQAPDLPGWAAVVVGLLLLGGALITLVGTLGLLRLDNFYDRVHAPTLGTTLGSAAVLMASMICFSVLQSRPVVHEILIGLFITMTTPVTLMLLARATIYRDRSEGAEHIPADISARPAEPSEDDGKPVRSP